MDLLLYILKVAALLALTRTGYRLLLARETFHRFNRCLLTGAAVLCWVLPACVLTLHRTVGVERAAEAALTLPDQAQAPLEALPAADPVWPRIVLALYAAGAAFVLLRWLLGALQMLRILHDGEQVRLPDGARVVVSDRIREPMSWLHRVVLPRADWERGCPEIIAHERAHIRGGHAEEDFLLEMLTAAQWFNPWMWALRRDLRTLHEYEADAAVLAEGYARSAYQLSLIGRAAAARGLQVGAPYGGEPLRQRIGMMLRGRSAGIRALRGLYLLPLVACALLANARTQTDFYYTAPAASTAAAETEAAPAVPCTELDVLPKCEYYSAGNLTAVAKEMVLRSYAMHELDDLEGLVPVQVIISASGQITSLQILTDRLREDQAAAIHKLVIGYGRWTPATKDGRTVAAELILPLDFGWR